MKVLYERVAGIDVHKDMVKVAIRSPGDKPWTRKTGIVEFRTFYGVLQYMARELRRRGVTDVVLEASGVYTEPVYYALCEQDFTEVAVINPAHAKALKGHKTDAKDCARLADASRPVKVVPPHGPEPPHGGSRAYEIQPTWQGTRVVAWQVSRVLGPLGIGAKRRQDELRLLVVERRARPPGRRDRTGPNWS
jgi:hypothetical protein